MSKLEFHRNEYKKCNTSTIVEVGVSLKLVGDSRILQKEETKYSYHKAVVILSPEKVIKMTKFEEEVNKHLEKEGLSRIKLHVVYGNMVYPKFKLDDPKTIILKGVWINAEKKSFPQLWLE